MIISKKILFALLIYYVYKKLYFATYCHYTIAIMYLIGENMKKNTKHAYKLSEYDKQAIILDYYLNRSKTNVSDICNKYSISESWLYRLVKSEQGKKALEQSIIQNKDNFTKKVDLLIDKALEEIAKKLNDEEYMKKANVKDISVMIGTLYDKARLEQNLSTNNSSINIRIQVEK